MLFVRLPHMFRILMDSSINVSGGVDHLDVPCRFQSVIPRPCLHGFSARHTVFWPWLSLDVLAIRF